MACCKTLQSGEKASQGTRALISSILKLRTYATRFVQDRATGNSPAKGATPSSPRAGPNSPGSEIAHDSQHPVTDAKTLADSSTSDSDPASANIIDATCGTHVCNSSTGSTRSPSLGTAASESESVVNLNVKAAANKAAHCGSEAARPVAFVV